MLLYSPLTNFIININNLFTSTSGARKMAEDPAGYFERRTKRALKRAKNKTKDLIKRYLNKY